MGEQDRELHDHITQAGREVFSHEFGAKDVIDPHDEIKMYWQWAFAWDGAKATLAKGPARVSIEIQKAAQASRQVDCFVLTNDLAYVPQGDRSPILPRRVTCASSRKHASHAFAADRQPPLESCRQSWVSPKVAGRDFLMPWNITKEFWSLYDKPRRSASALSVQC